MQKNKLNKGTALIVMMALFVAAAGFSSASLVVSVSSLQSSSGNGAVAMARTIANSGLEYATAELKRRAELSQGDFSVLDSLAATNPVYQNRPLDVPSVTGTKTLGTFTVNMKTVESNSKERVRLVPVGIINKQSL